MTTWILLRGLAREARHWGDFPGVLEAAFPDDRVITLELPGNGVLNAQRSPGTIAGMAVQARAASARLGLEPPFSLLAMSMGAMVAVAWAEAHPGEIARCVLMSTSFGAFSPPYQRLRPRALLALLGILLARTPEARERRVLALTSGKGRSHPGVAESWAALHRERPVRPGNALRQLLAAARYRAPPAPPVATLVLVGAGDRMVDPRCSERIARHWGCPLAVHPDAGHDLGLDAGVWVAGQIGSWLNG